MNMMEMIMEQEKDARCIDVTPVLVDPIDYYQQVKEQKERRRRTLSQWMMAKVAKE